MCICVCVGGGVHRGMIQHLRVVAHLPENLGSIPNNNMAAYTLLCVMTCCSPRGSDPVFCTYYTCVCCIEIEQ